MGLLESLRSGNKMVMGTKYRLSSRPMLDIKQGKSKVGICLKIAGSNFHAPNTLIR